MMIFMWKLNVFEVVFCLIFGKILFKEKFKCMLVNFWILKVSYFFIWLMVKVLVYGDCCWC